MPSSLDNRGATRGADGYQSELALEAESIPGDRESTCGANCPKKKPTYGNLQREVASDRVSEQRDSLVEAQAAAADDGSQQREHPKLCRPAQALCKCAAGICLADRRRCCNAHVGLLTMLVLAIERPGNKDRSSGKIKTCLFQEERVDTPLGLRALGRSGLLTANRVRLGPGRRVCRGRASRNYRGRRPGFFGLGKRGGGRSR